MNIKELREAIEGLPDHYTVTVSALEPNMQGQAYIVEIIATEATAQNLFSYGHALVIKTDTGLWLEEYPEC